VNCTQAQTLLAAYREQHDGDRDTTELEAHLEQCAACREVLAHTRVVGERIRLLPSLEPSPTFQSQLMEALAVEHTKFLQQSSVAPAPPDFLRPYLYNQVRSTRSPLHKQNPFLELSTAETGPLPILPTVKKTRSRVAMGQLAILGVAAVFFMVLMMGGITSLLLLAQNHVPPVPGSASVVHPTDVVTAAYTANTPYNHVVSAVSDSSAIYYSAYSNGDWMLERLDRATMTSTPLLAAPVQSSLIVLGSADGRLVWLQFDAPNAIKQGGIPFAHRIVRPWTLYYLPLASFQAGSSTLTPLPAPVEVVSGNFDESTASNWVYSPIEGIWFIQNTSLVAMVDSSGLSHLASYSLASNTSKIIANAPSGYLITSPTANDDGSQIYWAEEWQTSDGLLHSDIWMQQTTSAPRHLRGQTAPQTSVFKEPFLEDGMSFHPVVVDEALFFLSTANPEPLQGTQTPDATATAAAANALPPDTAIPATPWADISVYPTPLDSDIHGTILMYPLDDPTITAPTPVSSLNNAASLQAGQDFVLWQTDSGYGMYDALTRSPVTVGEVLNDAQFLAVNGNTTVWMVNTGQSTPTSVVGGSLPVTLKVFNWPS